MAGIDLSLSGLASGFDWKSLIEQLLQVQRAPQQRLLAEQSRLNQKNSAYDNIKTQLGNLQTRAAALKDALLFDTRTAQTSDASAATTTADQGTALGAYTFNITQLAAASRINGLANIGKPLSSTNDVSALVITSADFPSPVTAGTFTVNGKQITIESTDTLQQVFDKIAVATGGQVTAAYDSATDKITLTGSGEIILGSATDTSNFLLAARLYNNGTSSISSSTALGSLRLSETLATANLATAISDGGSGAGEFKINGVSINFNAGTDTLNDVLKRINSSTAGVSATYDAQNDRLVLISKATGDIGIALEDVTGNFLAATGLSSGTLARGQNLIYTVNGSEPLISQSNTITEATSGISGLSVTALKDDSTFTVTVGSDTAVIKTAIQDFIEAYNRVQSLIDSQTASSTDAKGNVTAGILADENDADSISSSLRSTIYSVLSGLSGTIKHLADLGISTNGNDNSIALDDAARLDDALANKLTDVREFFTNATSGMAVKLDDYLTKTIGDEGALATHQSNLVRQSKDIDLQIADMERVVLAEKDRLTASFIAMETAQARINQQLQYLSQQLAQL